MTEQTQTKPIDIFTIGETPVTLSYEGMGAAPMTFFLRPYLLTEDRALRQVFFAQSDAEQEDGQATHDLEMLARLSTRAPEGIEGFTESSNIYDSIRTYFGDNNPMKRKVVADVLTRYYRVTQPAEFFRGV